MRGRCGPMMGLSLSLLWVFLHVLGPGTAQGMSGNHGGVPMGVTNVMCDDAVHKIEIDWDPNSTAEHTCDGETFRPSVAKIESSCEEEAQQGIHVCYPGEIHYDDIPPTSGRHRPNWPKYGEYRYVPPQRWLHNMEHGAIVMLYHPCADPQQVQELRNIVKGCLRKHIITPSKLLPPETPFALLSWGCKVLMSSVVPGVATNFIKSHAKHAPEGEVSKDGKYEAGLTFPAQVALGSNFKDEHICPTASPSAVEGLGGASLSQRINPIISQSLQRRQVVRAETEKLERNVRNLVQAYRRLVSKK